MQQLTEASFEDISKSMNLNGKDFKPIITSIDKIEMWKDNPRVISEEAVDAVYKSIQKFGFLGAILVNQDNIIINGHTRYMAAIKAGFKSLPVQKIVADEVHFRAINIADNKTAEFSKWDDELLRDSIFTIESMDEEFLDVIAYTDEEIEDILSVSDIDEEETKKPKKKKDKGISDRSNVKMVQIFFNSEAFKEFNEQCEDLKEELGTESVTEVVAIAIQSMHEGLNL